jgi:hypothetical protein
MIDVRHSEADRLEARTLDVHKTAKVMKQVKSLRAAIQPPFKRLAGLLFKPCPLPNRISVSNLRIAQRKTGYSMHYDRHADLQIVG